MMVTNQAKVGESILFSRKGIDVYGEVTMIREKSVVVRIDPEIARTLQLETSLTVVNHLSYKIIQ